MFGRKRKSVVVCNGNRIEVSGSNISVINGRVFVDGKEYTDEDKNVKYKDITIVVNGSPEVVRNESGNIIVRGDVKGNVGAASGDIEISGNVGGNVSTLSGDVRAKSIYGQVSTVSGDVN